MAERTPLQALQVTIKKKGYDWKAAETPQGAMSVEEQKSLLKTGKKG